MAESQETPLDELCFSLPPAVEHFRGIRAENIHLYFLASPFCDPTSNNKQVEFQNNRHPDGWRVLADRDSFESRVKKIGSGGIDYYVEGAKTSGPDVNPVWVITKNQREIATGQARTKLIGTYFAFGERIYQAPSVADIISSRLAYTSNLLSEFFKEAADMQFYTPATGYSYVPPTLKSTQTSSGLDSTRQSRSGTPVPDSQQSQPRSEPDVADASSNAFNDDAMLMASFNATLMYQDEYIDENPLHGEPGSFVFAHSNSQVQSQKEKEKLSQQQQDSQDKKAAAASAPGSSRGPSAAPTPLPPIKTDAATLQRKGSKALSPTTASAGTQSANPYKSQKSGRRKSKAVTPGGSSAT